MNQAIRWLGNVGLGAGRMYVLELQSGPRRRADLVGRLKSLFESDASGVSGARAKSADLAALGRKIAAGRLSR